jgi:hypothetical protein
MGELNASVYLREWFKATENCTQRCMSKPNKTHKVKLKRVHVTIAAVEKQ